MTTMLNHALAYARAGYGVLPLRGKIPLTAHGSHDATTDEGLIRSWWAIWPAANIGITLAGLVVVDIDPRNGGDFGSLPHPLPHTCIAATGGGGLHYLYRASPGVKYPGTLGYGIDQKSGPFAYIVVGPSIHASGQQYVWLNNASPLVIQPSAAPEWLSHRRDVPRAIPRPHAPSRAAPSAGAWLVLGDDDHPTGETVTFNRRAEAARA